MKTQLSRERKKELAKRAYRAAGTLLDEAADTEIFMHTNDNFSDAEISYLTECLRNIGAMMTDRGSR